MDFRIVLLEQLSVLETERFALFGVVVAFSINDIGNLNCYNWLGETPNSFLNANEKCDRSSNPKSI